MRRVYRDCRRPRDSFVRHDSWFGRDCRNHDPRGSRLYRAAASDPARLHRRPGRAVRILFERRHPDRQGFYRSESASYREPDSRGAVGRALSLLHTCANDPGHRRLRAEGCMTLDLTPEARKALDREGFSRRHFLRGSGALIVGFSAAAFGSIPGVAPERVEAQPARATDSQLDGWLAIAADGTVTAFTGKCELGQGMFTVQT